MAPSLTPERIARAQNSVQALSETLLQQIRQSQPLASTGCLPLLKAITDISLLLPSLYVRPREPLLQQCGPFIMALLHSAIPLLHSATWESEQARPMQLVSASIALIKSMSEMSLQEIVPENGFSNLEGLMEIFAAIGFFWENVHAKNVEENAENYAIENYEHALTVAEQTKSTSTHREEEISETYTRYWRLLESKVQRTKRREDFDATVKALRRSGQFTQSEEVNKICQVTLANLLWMMWRSTPQVEALFEDAVDSSREVIEATSRSQTRRGELLDRYITMQNYLLEASRIYHGWFTNQEVFWDLDAAVKAAALAYHGLWPEMPRSVQETATRQFGDVSRERYDWAGDFDDIRHALAAARSALARFPCGPGQVDFNWSKCAMRLMDFSSFHDMEDCLDEAERLLKRSLKHYEGVIETPTQWVSCERAICLQFLSKVYRMRWRRRCMHRGSRRSLDLSVKYADKAFALLHDKDPLLSEGVDNRTLAYYTRFLFSDDEPSDLDTAIASATRGVSLGAHNYSNIHRAPRVAERMTVVSIGIAGAILAARYLRDGCPSDLDAAIHAIEMQLKLLPPMNPKRAHALQTYRDLLELKLKFYLRREDRGRRDNLLRRSLFKVSGSSSPASNYFAKPDLDRLRDLDRREKGRLQDSTLDAIRRPKMLAMMLGDELLYEDFSPVMYARGSYPTDLRLSIDRPGLCTNGSARPLLDEARFVIDNVFNDIGWSDVKEETLAHLESLSSADLDTPQKVRHMFSLGEWMFEHRRWKGLQAIWRYCFRTLDSQNLHTARTKEYRSLFRSLSVLAVMVASSMLAQGQEIWSIILVLERGREVLNSLSFLPTRSQRIKYSPHLERQVEELVADLKNPGLERNHEYRRSQFRHLGTFERNSREMVKAVQDLITCETDMAPFGSEHIIKQSQAGPIVMLVATPVGAHAIIITASDTRTIVLGKCHYEEAVKKSEAARMALSQCEQDQSLVGDANQELRQLLKWLWDTIAHPVVVSLGLVGQKAVEKLPRIQWVCCGIFSRLPVHAAGIFSKPGKPHLAQYAVSSYLSSVRYTIMAKRKDPYLRPTQSQILVVSMPHTEADDSAVYGDLDTEAERVAISRNLPRSLGSTYLTSPDMGSVESLIGGCRITHFSCHGVIDSADPVRSRLVICSDAQRPLTVAAIRDLSSSFSRLAFLSACHAANFEDLSTADEVVHVAKAFQLAGFPSVVGTLWQAFDGDAAIVSGEFYRYIARQLDSGAVKELDGDLFARALHSAVGRLREKNPYSCASWASWIHYGD